MYAIRAFAYPGDKVVIQTPVYPPFHAITKNNGCQLVTNPLVQDENGKFQIDFEDLTLLDAKRKHSIRKRINHCR